MKKIRIFFILLLIQTINFNQEFYLLRAQTYFNSGARHSSLSYSGVAVSDLWSISNNQAGLAFLSTASAGIHRDSRFLINELGLSSIAAAFPIKSATFGAQLNYFGFSKYNETKAAVAVAKAFGEKFAIGIQADLFNTFLQGNESIQKIVFESGLLYKGAKNLNFGFHVLNPLPGINGGKDDDIYIVPTLYRMGVSYTYANKGMLTAEIEKDLRYSPVFKTGIEYMALQNMALRLGISTGDNLFTGGLGYNYKKLQFDFAFAFHQTLGLTPFFTVTYSRK